MSDLVLQVSVNDQWILRSALERLHRSTAQQRGMSECNLAEGCSDFDVVTRLALHEELELAAIDGLLEKLRWGPRS